MNLDATIEKYESTLAYYKLSSDPNPTTAADVKQLIEWLKDYKRLLGEVAKKDEEIKSLKAELDIKAESKSKTPELKPCPFCGTEVKMLKKALYGYPGCFDFEVRCPKCGCTLDYTHADSLYHSEEEAIRNVTKKWNEQVETKMTVTEFADRCRECGAKYGKLLKKEEVKRKQYMKYIAVGGVALEVNKEIELGAKVVLMVPFLRADSNGSHTAGYNVLFEKEEEDK